MGRPFQLICLFVEFWYSAWIDHFDRIGKINTKCHYNSRVLFHKAPRENIGKTQFICHQIRSILL